MCWAAADRMALVAARQAPALEQECRAAAARIQEDIIAQAWNPGDFAILEQATE
jgi:hypothetical protein